VRTKFVGKSLGTRLCETITLPGFIGIDALLMANIAKLLNLRFIILPVDITGYGGKSKYGNYTGKTKDRKKMRKDGANYLTLPQELWAM
jgi:hypothetical protein